jgi:hypothetical protein
MKKYLIGIICFFACTFSIQAQTLYGTRPVEELKEEVLLVNLSLPTNNLTVAKSFESLASPEKAARLPAVLSGKRWNSYMAWQAEEADGYGVIFPLDPSLPLIQN